MVTLGGLVMIVDLHRQGLSVSAIARRAGHDRKTVRRYVGADGQNRRSDSSPRWMIVGGNVGA